MTAPVARQRIMEIHPYVAGESTVDGKEPIAKLSSNESPLGPSPRAIEAFTSVTDRLERYPDSGSVELRTALAAHHGLEVDRIICCDGSSQALDMIVRSYVGPGDEVLFNDYGFLVYRLATLSAGGEIVTAPERDFTVHVDALVERVTERTKIVFLANPNNPTGTYLPRSEVERLRRELPDGVLLVIDAAYAEYVTARDYDSCLDMVDSGADNVVVTRTFSKIYGLAALRVGWIYCPAGVAAVLNRVRDPFNLSVAAQEAARAALADTAYMEKARAHNAEWLPWLTREVRGLGLAVTPSVANFILIHFENEAQCRAAEGYLKAAGIILRPLQAYSLSQCLRATIGLESENRAVVDCLKSFLKKS